ncbi:MAG: PadR family transcriptional regulator [Clostridia bacterium]|nr:PadR family transcriptional regulator [Clostridia bacterium]NCC43189.1 PadR family transcriptional regulator [Clostridia bacterium]
MKFIKQETDDRVLLGAGTLYGALNSLLSKGWIHLYDEDSHNKKTYLITNEGKQIVENELKRLNQLCKTSRKIIREEADSYGED